MPVWLDILHEEMACRNLDAATLAEQSGLQEWLVREVLAGTRKITPVVEIGFAKAFGTGRGFWQRLQCTPSSPSAEGKTDA